jgi:hypothetical protein
MFMLDQQKTKHETAEDAARECTQWILNQVDWLWMKTPWYRRINIPTYVMQVVLFAATTLAMWQHNVVASVVGMVGSLWFFELNRRTAIRCYNLPRLREIITSMKMAETGKLYSLCCMLRDARDSDTETIPEHLEREISRIYSDAKLGLSAAMRISMPHPFTGAPTSLPLPLPE